MQTPAENEWLTRARLAAKQGNTTATQMYYSTFLLQNPDNGKIFSEFLDAVRAQPGTNRQLVDVSVQNALSKLMPTQTPHKVLETSLEKLRTTPNDLDAVQKIGRCAQSAGWHTLAIAAFIDILKLSPLAKSPGSKLARELKLSLGQLHYQLDDFKAAYDTLKEFERDPSANKEVLQILKDSAANLASAAFTGKESAHALATAQSVTIATASPQQKSEQELSDLLSQFNDAKLDNAKLCSVALRLAEHFTRAKSFDKALELLHKSRERLGPNGEVAKKIVEVNIRRRSEAIDSARKNSQDVVALQSERDEFVVAAYTELCAALPTDGEVHFRLGEGLLILARRSKDESQLKEAVGHLQFDFKTDEHFNQSRLLLAECFLALELPAAAEIVLSEFLVRIESSRKGAEYYLDAQYLLGVVREKLRDTRGAMSAYMTVIGRNIKFKDAFDRLRRLDSQRAVSA